MKKYSTLLGILLLTLLTAVRTQAQNSWNANNFTLTTDTVSLENMSGANLVTFPAFGIRATDTIAFPAGFKFRYGTDEYRQFSLSTYGWLKLGAGHRSNSFFTEDSIINVFSNMVSQFACTYKLVGDAPYRRFVVEWSGTFAGGSQPVRFQLWLHETNGRIAMVHQSVNNFFSGGYYSFCKTKIFGQRSFACIDVRTPPQTPLVNYNTEVSNQEAIPAKTRYTFQPDTVKPKKPGVYFANILPGCFRVDVADSSTTEVVLTLEKKQADNNFSLLSRTFSTTTATTGTLYPYNETNMKPDSLYTYQAFVSNGFANSDTFTASLLTPAPLIYGTKTIPGDYATINALLQDAVCKHIGPNLVIELQSSYSFAAEGSTVRFKPVHVNKFIQSITIRPAASATNLVLNNTAAYPLIMVDSVPFVHIDGRAGGIGTNNNLTISQTDINQPAIAFVNNANSGGVHYTNLQGNGKNSNNGLLLLAARDPLNYGVYYNNAANNTTIDHCKIGPASGFTYKALVIEKGDNNIIRENEFFRFFMDAITYAEGGNNSRIIKNRLYQPEPMPSQDGFTASSSAGAIVATNVNNNFAIDSNRLGGSSPVWGVGSWKQDINSSSGGYAPIRLTQNVYPSSTAYIRYNEIGNLNITSSNFLFQIYAKGGRLMINNNKLGTTDSLGSIVSTHHQLGIYSIQAISATISNNFIGGLKGNGDGSLIWTASVDSLTITGNNVGGASAYNTNWFGGRASGIEFSGNSYGLIRRNEVQGIISETTSSLGIIREWNAGTNVVGYCTVDSNKIHHLNARRTLLGIFMSLGTAKDNVISNNEIYALRGRGPSTFTGADNPTQITGIGVSARESTYNVPSRDTNAVYIRNNNIYALDYSTPSRSYIYPVTGIATEGLKFRIHNNMISLGQSTTGVASDSTEMACTGIDVYSAYRAEVEHNSIYMGGASRDANFGIKMQTTNYPGSQYSYVLSNNITQIDRRPTTISDNQYYVSDLSNPVSNVVANKNIWFSSSDATINTKLQQWRNNCQCDSLSFIANPQMINPGGDSATVNLHLQAINPADSAGTPSVGVIPTDFDNQLRNSYSPVDIGADAATPCAMGNASISLSPAQEKIEICAGSTLTLTATVNGGVTEWQWQKNLNNIPGATALTYTATTPGLYRLVGRTACGWIASPAVRIISGITQPYVKLLAVTPAPYCDSTNVVMKVDHNHFSLTTLQYKWYRNSVLIPGRTSDTITIEGIRNNDNIAVQVTNPTACGNAQVNDNMYFNNVYASNRFKVNILSMRDTLYSVNSNDTVKYKMTSASGFFSPTVIYTSPVPGPLHSYISDSLIVFHNIPYTFSFRLSVGNPGLLCEFPDTTQQKTIYVTNSQAPKTYTFNGTGNWNDPANWSNNEVPSSPLPFNGTIIINSGVCTLNVPFTIGIGGQLTIASGATLIVQGNLIRQ